MPNDRSNSQVIVADPACVQLVGHNLEAMQRFGQLVGHLGKVHLLGCQYLPVEVAAETGIKRFFDWYYPGVFTNALFPKTAASNLEGRLVGDQFEAAAVRDVERMFKSFDLSDRDLIVYPSADIYGVLAVLRVLASLPPERRPSIKLRLLNVMEHGAPGMKAPRDELLQCIAWGLSIGLPLSISAETARYAGYLAARLSVVVQVTPFPAAEQFCSLPVGREFVVGHLGQPRRDKGFFDLFGIIKAARWLDRGNRLRFVVQVPQDHEWQDDVDYLSQLYALPGVNFVTGPLDRRELNERIAQCHCIILPYDERVYAQRGSALALEAVRMWRPLVTSFGVGFAPEIAYYGLGVVAGTPMDFSAAVMQLSLFESGDLQRQMTQGLRRLKRDSDRAYGDWLGSRCAERLC